LIQFKHFPPKMEKGGKNPNYATVRVTRNLMRNYVYTQLKTIRLLQYWWKQDWTMLCGPHCLQLSTILLHPIQGQEYCSMLLTSVNNVGRTTLFNPVKQQAHNFYACTLAVEAIARETLITMATKCLRLIYASRISITVVYFLITFVDIWMTKNTYEHTGNSFT
jgi:hypothetical protein